MGRNRENWREFMADFETTVYDGQEYTEVWAAAIVELGSEDVQLFHSISEFFKYVRSLKCNCRISFHNLKFDGAFIMDYLINTMKYNPALERTGKGKFDVKFKHRKEMVNREYELMISDMGSWYTITVMLDNYMIEFRDSLKLLPFTVKQIGKAFNTKHQKLDMEYAGLRYAGCYITPEEEEYIKNDVLVVAEALVQMKSMNLDQLTIGACCMKIFKDIFGDKNLFDAKFPNVHTIPIDPERFGCADAGHYIRKAYRGGWCYAVPEKTRRLFDYGLTADVNSLYPSRMHSESGCRYPVGAPHFWSGDFIPKEAQADDKYYYIRFRSKFKLKPGYLPFVQIKGSFLYKGTEMLRDSRVYDPNTGQYHDYYIDIHGQLTEARPTITMTMTDYQLFLEHYEVSDMEILDGCWFKAETGLFDKYIDIYRKMKLESKDAVHRTIAKLMLNNLYGKYAASTDSSFKLPVRDENGLISYIIVHEELKKPGYIPIGAAITSYAREFTIRAAQKNYHGPDKPGFIYADTDSIHCDLHPNELIGVPTDPKAFNHWKVESIWSIGWFVRAKTYIELVVADEDAEILPEPFYNVKCAGMPDKCKQLFIDSMLGEDSGTAEAPEEKAFISVPRTMLDFDVGLEIPGKLVPKHIAGGVILVETPYKIRKGMFV